MDKSEADTSSTAAEPSSSRPKLFIAVGYFAEPNPDHPELDVQFNEHLAQPYFRLKLAGPLRDGEGNVIGFMGLVEADEIGRAERFLNSSPYFKAGLYDRVEVAEFAVQIGRLD